MNNLGINIIPGTIVRVGHEYVKPEYAVDAMFVCLGGGGMQSGDRDPYGDDLGDWHVYGVWQLDGAHGIISSDLISEIVSVPTKPLRALLITEMLDWIKPTKGEMQ
jgi:hypothetical protein